ncbi:MAG: Omp28-related outer membrane protein [Muribaculaceae bacterium]|nr:Omp28-related outer membrane protein [Muribaculaceae bacterium]
MKKILLSLCMAVAGVAMVQAQALVPRFTTRAQQGPLVLKSQVAKAPVFKALGENEMYLGPYAGDAIASSDEGLGLPGYPQTFMMGAMLPVDMVKPFDGSTLKAIRFGVCAPIEDGAVFLFKLSKTSPVTVSDTVAWQTVDVTSAGWNMVELTTPAVIDTEGAAAFLLGYQYKQKNTTSGGYYTEDCYPISAVEEGVILPTYTYGKLGSTTASWTDIGLSDYGNLSVQGIVESESFPEYNLALSSLQCAPFAGGDTGLDYVLSMSNIGTKTLEDYDLNLLIDGEVVETLHAPIVLTQTISTYEGNLSLDNLASGNHTLAVQAVKVLGEEVTDVEEVSASFMAYAYAFPRQKQLVEHITSQGCTYCPLGENVLKKLEDLRGDLAWVSIHGNMNVTDVFNSTKCNQLLNYLGASSFPSAVFNRYDAGFTGELPRGIGYGEQYATIVAQMFNDDIESNPTPALANIDLSGTTYDPETRQLTVTVAGNVTEDFNIVFGNQVAMTVYVLEDSLVARQLNAGTWVPNAIHNHVLRDVLSEVKGSAINMNDDNTYSNTYTITLNEAWNADQMRVVAFLSRTGAGVNKEVINADLLNIKDITIEEPIVTGDVTGDGKVDVEDVNAVINIILKSQVAGDYPGQPDVNGDGKIDVEDVNAIINLILKVD